MKKRSLSVLGRGPLSRLGVAICLLLLSWLAWAGPALADDPPQSSGEGDLLPCLGCHTVETAAWSQSPHALASREGQQVGATCEDCHGPYVNNHGEKGGMVLRSDSSMCQGCHEETFAQWQTSRHGTNGVQCIGCHQPHSQERRLTDLALCESCHREHIDDIFHFTHSTTEAICTTCHMASTPQGGGFLVSASSYQEPNATSNHDFISVSAPRCIECHREDVAISTKTFDTRQASARQQLTMADGEVLTLNSRLNAARDTNKFLSGLTMAGLGLGIGVGLMVGITLAVVVGYVSRRSNEQ